MKQTFDEQLSAYINRIEGYLDCCFVYPEEPQQKLFEAMRYSLLSGGKRLRPVLVQAFCEVCGGRGEVALPFAAAVDMVHTYSLIHDDLPCMDNDDLRRGKPTSHKVYGEASAILAGDGLLTAAFTRLTMAKLPPERIVAAVRTLSLCAGELGMVGGQVLDMAAEERRCTPQEVCDIQCRKTGALFCAACQLGVIAAGGTQAQLDAAAAYADALGLAFQIQDDILDVIGDVQKLGKATGADGNKNTFVQIFGIEQCQKMVEDETQKAIEALGVFENREFLTVFAQRLIKREN